MDIEIDESTRGFKSLIEKKQEENEQMQEQNEQMQEENEQTQEECPQNRTTPTPLSPEDNSDKLTEQQQLDETTKLICQLTPPEIIPKTFLEQLRELRQKQQKQQSEEENQKKYQSLLDEMETQTQMNGLIELQKNKENTKNLQNKKGSINKLAEILKKQAILQSKATSQLSTIPSNPTQEELKKLKEIKVEEGDIPKVQEINGLILQSKQKELRKDTNNNNSNIQGDRIVNLSEVNQKFLFKPKKTKAFLPTEVKYFLMFAGKRKRQNKFERAKKQAFASNRTYVEGEEEFKPNHNRTEKDRAETLKILRQHRQPLENQNDRERSRDYKTSSSIHMNTGGQKTNQTFEGKTQIAQRQEQKQSHFSKTIQDYKSQSRAIRSLQEILEEERLQKENGPMEIESKQNEKQSNSNVSKDFERIKEFQKKEQMSSAEMKQKIINKDFMRNNESIAKNIRNTQSQQNNSSSNCIITTSQPKITVDEKHVKTDIPKKVTITTTTPSSSSNPAVQGIEPASSSSISKKKGIVRGAEYFRQRKAEQEQEKKQFTQQHNQSHSQVKVEFEEQPTLPSAQSKAKQTLSSSSLKNQDKFLESKRDNTQLLQKLTNPSSESKLKVKKEEKDDIHTDISSQDKPSTTHFEKSTLIKQEVITPAKSIWVSKKLLKGSNQSNQPAKNDSNQSSTCTKIDVKIEQVTTRSQELSRKKSGIKKQPTDLSYFVVDTSGDEEHDDDNDDDADANDNDENEQEDSFDYTKHKRSRILVKEENSNTKQKTSFAGVLEQPSQEAKSKIKTRQDLNKSSMSGSMLIKQETKEQPQPTTTINSAPKQQSNLSAQQSAIPQTRSQSYQQQPQQQYAPLSSVQSPQQQLQSKQQPTIASQPQQKSSFYNNPNGTTEYSSRTPQGNNFVFINNALKGNTSSFIPSSTQNQAFLDYKMTNNNLFPQPFNAPGSLLKSTQPANNNMNSNNNNLNSTFTNNSNNSQISSIMSFIRESDRGFLSQMLEKTKNDNSNANKVGNGNSQRQLF